MKILKVTSVLGGHKDNIRVTCTPFRSEKNSSVLKSNLLDMYITRVIQSATYWVFLKSAHWPTVLPGKGLRWN